MKRRRIENREGSLGYHRFVRPVFTKDSKPLGKRKRSLGHFGILTPKEVQAPPTFFRTFLGRSTKVFHLRLRFPSLTAGLTASTPLDGPQHLEKLKVVRTLKKSAHPSLQALKRLEGKLKDVPP
ncbi:hypothetical protein TNCV_2640271 [Trichonephila clavipes]|nr:hypothetical protein TNCV_2640271 [Trichonephila clavipes]